MAGKQGHNLAGSNSDRKLGGRRKGSKDRKTYMLEEILSSKKSYAHLFEEGVFTGSACFWIEVMEDTSNGVQTRLKASEYLAKYLNYSKPVLTETNFTTDIADKSFAISFASPEQQKKLANKRWEIGADNVEDVLTYVGPEYNDSHPEFDNTPTDNEE
jgi:hypothetical protein